MISTISHHADRAAALLDQLPRGALPSERAAIVQQAIDAALAVTPVSIELSQMLALVKRDVDAVVDRIREATDGALDGCCINEAVAILISQRDNARGEADYYRNLVSALHVEIEHSERKGDLGDNLRATLLRTMTQHQVAYQSR